MAGALILAGSVATLSLMFSPATARGGFDLRAVLHPPDPSQMLIVGMYYHCGPVPPRPELFGYATYDTRDCRSQILMVQPHCIYMVRRDTDEMYAVGALERDLPRGGFLSTVHYIVVSDKILNHDFSRLRHKLLQHFNVVYCCAKRRT